jgi:hypothetical protein
MKFRRWALILAQGHSTRGGHTSRPTTEAVWPAWSITVGLVQPSKQPGRPTVERPTDPRHRAWVSVLSRAVTAHGARRGGAVPTGSPVVEVENDGRGEHRR